MIAHLPNLDAVVAIALVLAFWLGACAWCAREARRTRRQQPRSRHTTTRKDW